MTLKMSLPSYHQHTGTSASSPMAAGIVALALEANPELNWRDIQHITVRTSRPKGNLKAEDWSTNGVGRQFSHAFGFGLMDAGAMTREIRVPSLSQPFPFLSKRYFREYFVRVEMKVLLYNLGPQQKVNTFCQK